MLTFEVINELTLKVTCEGNDTLITKAGAFIAGENAGAKNYSFEKMIQRKEWNNLGKMSKDFNKYSPDEVLKKEIDRLLKGGK